MRKQSHERARCGAQNRAGEPCKLPPATGRTRCRFHGGANPGPGPKNLNAVTHGAYSRLPLQPDEIAAGADAPADNSLALLEDEIRLLRARIYRVLKWQRDHPDDVEAGQRTITDLQRELRGHIEARTRVEHEQFEREQAAAKTADDLDGLEFMDDAPGGRDAK